MIKTSCQTLAHAIVCAIGMVRQRVLLLESDAVLESVLCDVLADEDLDVSVCASLSDLLSLVEQ